MILHLNLTEDHLRLVTFLHIREGYEKDYDNGEIVYIRKNDPLTMRMSLLDDIATILGLRDRAIEGTSEDADGSAYPDEVEKRMTDAYNYVKDNLYAIETLLHQNVMTGIKPGHYKCRDNEMYWEFVGE